MLDQPNPANASASIPDLRSSKDAKIQRQNKLQNYSSINPVDDKVVSAPVLRAQLD